MTKILKFNKEAREALKQGIDLVADAVKITLGPKGRNVVISRPHKGEPDIVNDGATIARSIAVKDPFVEQGVELIKSVSLKTESNAGDGTTTAAILAQSISSLGLEAVNNGANPVLLKRGIELAIERVVKFLKEKAMPVKPEEVAKIATMSAEDETIGNTIAEILNKHGKEAVISVEESSNSGISYETVLGYQFESGWVSPYLINRPDRFECVLENVYVAILDRKVTMLPDLTPLLDRVVKEAGKKELVIIAEEFGGDALATLLVNKIQGRFLGLAISAPSFGKQRADLLEDMAIFTGATKISAETGFKMEEFTLGMFGKCQKVIATREETVLIGGSGDSQEVEDRVSQLKLLSEADGCPEYEKKRLAERIAKLTGTATIMKIGYDSQVEMTYKKLKVEDTISATKAALEEGIVPGGGIMYLQASKELENTGVNENDVATGIEIVKKALIRPISQLIENSGMDVEGVLSEIQDTPSTYGLNVSTGQIEDLLIAGIVDPVKVERLALINAGSVAKTLLTAEVVIVDEPKKENANSNQ